MSLVILVVPILLYANTFKNGFVIDDNNLIIRNPLIRNMSMKSLITIFTSHYWYPTYPSGDLYRPLTIFSYALNYVLSRLNPRSYHVANVLLHALVCLMIYWLVLRSYGKEILACITALLFAIHPIHTEAVAGVAGRADLLSTFFMLSSLWLYVLSQSRMGRPMSHLRLLSLSFFFLALLSKESAVVLPFLIILYDLVFRHKCKGGLSAGLLRGLSERFRSSHLAYFAVVALYFLIRKLVLGAFLRPSDVKVSSLANPLFEVDPYTRFLMAAKITAKYLKLLLVPTNLCADYSYNQIPVSRSWDWEAVLGLFVLGSLVYLTFRFYRDDKGHSSFPSGFFLITFFPVSNMIFPIGTIMAERLMYMPSLAFCLSVSIAAVKLYEISLPQRHLYSPLVFLALAGLFYVHLTVKRNRDWLNEYTLYTQMVRVAPNSAAAHFALGNILEPLGRSDEAIAEYKRAIQIKPDYIEARLNLGLVYANKGLFDLAVSEIRLALQLNPDYDQSYNALGQVLLKMSRVDEAISYFNEAISKSKGANARARLNLGTALQNKGLIEEAISEYKRVLEMLPDSAEAHYRLGLAYAAKGDEDKAQREYLEALRLNPNHREAIERVRKQQNN